MAERQIMERRELITDPSDRPAVDEWGIYDPEKAGLAAVRERIEARLRVSTDTDASLIATSMRAAERLMRAAPARNER
jgi:hypothetical protein